MKTRLILVVALVVSQVSFGKSVFSVHEEVRTETVVTDPVAPNLSSLTLCANNDGIGVFDLTVKTPIILAAQSGPASNYSVVYYWDISGTLVIATPTNFNTSGTQMVYYKVTNTSTNSIATGMFSLVVNSRPNASFPPDIYLCDTNNDGIEIFNLSTQVPIVLGALNPLYYTVNFYTSAGNAEAGVSPIVSIFNYAGANNETIWCRVVDNSTGCYTIVNFHLYVPGTIIVPTPLAVCDSDANPNDQYTTFDLTIKNYEITQGGAGYTVTYYSNFPITGSSAPIANPTAYVNLLPAIETLGVKVTSPLGCESFTTLDIRVNPVPVLNNPPSLAVCDAGNGTGLFDLTSNLAFITNGDPNTVFHYYHTLSDAQNNSNEIFNIAPYTATTGDVWIRGENVFTDYQGNHCYSIVKQHLIVLNNAAPLVTQPNYPQYSLCDFTGAVGYETFDLASRISGILLGQLGMGVTFYRNLSDAQNNVNPITNLNYTNETLFVQTLGIRVTNTCSGAYAISSFDIRVEPLPTLITPAQPYAVCDDNQDGVASFDLDSLILDLTQGSNSQVTFYETMIEAQVGGNPIMSPYYNINPFYQVVYARGENSNTGCYSIIPIYLLVNPAPIAPAVPSIQVCDMDTNTQNGITSVDLTIQTPIILAAQPMESSTNYTISYYASQIAAVTGSPVILNPTSYVGSNGAFIWYRIEANATGCYAVGSFQTVINAAPLTMQPSYLPYVLFDYGNDGTETFDLTSQINNILMGQTGMVVTFYPSYSNAINNTNAIATPAAYVNAPIFVQTLGIRVINAAGCYSVSTMDISVDSTVPAPTGDFFQTFAPGATLADIVVNGSAILWYDAATNKNANTLSPLPLNTVLVDGATYYASQTINGSESFNRLPVTVHLALGVPTEQRLALRYAPNPVTGILYLEADTSIESVEVYSLLGQKVLQKRFDSTAVTIDLSLLARGVYILKASGATAASSFQIVKQ